MFCQNCGKEIEDGSLFCGFCGASQEAPTQPATDNAGSTTGSFNAGSAGSYNAGGNGGQFATSNLVKAPNPKVKKAIIGAVAGIAVIVAAVFGGKFAYEKLHKEKINLDDYVVMYYGSEVPYDEDYYDEDTIKQSMYDGKGTVVCTFDTKKLEKAIKKAAKIKGKKTLEELADKKDEYEDLYDVYKDLVKEQVSENLKNGDEVKYEYEYDNDAIAQYGIKFEGESKTFKIDGLQEVKEVDPFENIVVTFSGTAPNGYAEYTNNATDDAVKYTYFSFDKSYDLNVGDEVTLSVSSYDEDYYAKEYGVVFTQTEKKYTVEGLDTYVLESTQITDDMISELQLEAKEDILDYIDNNEDYLKLDGDLSYEGLYLFTDDYGYNVCYTVMSATVHNKTNDGKKKKDSDYDKDAFKDTKVYFAVRFNSLKALADGTFTVDSYHYLVGSSKLEFGWWSTVNGFESVKDMTDYLEEYDSYYTLKAVVGENLGGTDETAGTTAESTTDDAATAETEAATEATTEATTEAAQ